MRYQIRHALVQYGADTILEDLNFEIHDNEKIAVVGRNGCGKTTLLKLITAMRNAASPWQENSTLDSCARSALRTVL